MPVRIVETMDQRVVVHPGAARARERRQAQRQKDEGRHATARSHGAHDPIVSHVARSLTYVPILANVLRADCSHGLIAIRAKREAHHE